MAGRHKVIDGKRFFRYRVGLTKREADSMSDDLQERYLVRVLPHKGKWAVYCREK
ncbi:hypothetical protein LCGC14_1595210 [marine sediment metagenome]|uniref:Uncharacterized protein n=1 Tax=marine sediment metagenome TaxID=412755 RepID=A0A0F9KTH6_9ZZZZ